jgi:hypothetical protein
MRRRSARLAISPGRAIWLVLALTALCPACSGGRNKVTGKVIYDGSPIKNAVVSFHPKNADASALRPTGVTDENGVFNLTTQNEDGALAGEYRVTVVWLEETPDNSSKSVGLPEPPKAPADKLKGRYGDPEKSELNVTIKSGRNELPPFELKKVD